MLIASSLLILLTGCGALATSETVFQTRCPPLAAYEKDFRVRVADELDALGGGAATREMIADYATLREQCRALNAL